MLFFLLLFWFFAHFHHVAAGNNSKKCGEMMEKVFFTGDQLSQTLFVSYDDCCSRCTSHDSCVAFVMGGAWKGEHDTCTLLSSVKSHVSCDTGPQFHSVRMDFGHEECATNAFASCGNSMKHTCCPHGQYCQPWQADYYQCLPESNLAQCDNLETDVDYCGNDLHQIRGISPGDCCAECNKMQECQAFTFVNDQADGAWCYLKRNGYGRASRKGALSGLKKL
jgi:hypothetical protein